MIPQEFPSRRSVQGRPLFAPKASIAQRAQGFWLLRARSARQFQGPGLCWRRIRSDAPHTGMQARSCESGARDQGHRRAGGAHSDLPSNLVRPSPATAVRSGEKHSALPEKTRAQPRTIFDLPSLIRRYARSSRSSDDHSRFLRSNQVTAKCRLTCVTVSI